MRQRCYRRRSEPTPTFASHPPGAWRASGRARRHPGRHQLRWILRRSVGLGGRCVMRPHRSMHVVNVGCRVPVDASADARLWAGESGWSRVGSLIAAVIVQVAYATHRNPWVSQGFVVHRCHSRVRGRVAVGQIDINGPAVTMQHQSSGWDLHRRLGSTVRHHVSDGDGSTDGSVALIAHVSLTRRV